MEKKRGEYTKDSTLIGTKAKKETLQKIGVAEKKLVCAYVSPVSTSKQHWGQGSKSHPRDRSELRALSFTD